MGVVSSCVSAIAANFDLQPHGSLWAPYGPLWVDMGQHGPLHYGLATMKIMDGRTWLAMAGHGKPWLQIWQAMAGLWGHVFSLLGLLQWFLVRALRKINFQLVQLIKQ